MPRIIEQQHQAEQTEGSYTDPLDRVETILKIGTLVGLAALITIVIWVSN